MNWILMVISLPTENATIRMRAWRALKACGAAVLRDGAYLLPQLGECRSTLDAIGADVRAGGGTAYVLSTDEPDSVQFSTLFDRSEDYSALLVQIADAHQALNAETAISMLKQARKLRQDRKRGVEGKRVSVQ